jgi:isochorismate pyruvate lyase
MMPMKCYVLNTKFKIGDALKYIIVSLLVVSFAFAEETTLSSYYDVAKESCHTISDIRVQMNRINAEILRLLAERTAYVKRAGDIKSKDSKIADDRQRVADQEKIIIEKSNELEVPLEISLPTFRAIVENSILYQQRHIDEITHN